MYLRHLNVRHLKLLRDVTLDFTLPDGTLRNWTVIIGKNGTGKSSLLQAIALAAAGRLQVNVLAKGAIGHLRDRRGNEALEVEADFEFSADSRAEALHPMVRGPLPETAGLRSSVRLGDGEKSIRAASHYTGSLTLQGDDDPLDVARSQNLRRWFVAGYGVARFLTDGVRATLDQPAIERMRPLFDPTLALTGIRFSGYFGDEDKDQKARLFHRVLKQALFNVEAMLPGIDDLELRGHGGVTAAGDLLEGNRFSQHFATGSLKFPGAALAHGYQSTIAWVADLVGHILLESQTEIEPKDMEGLVLIDEIDLYLHPAWQRALIPALRATFPAMQFIVTTHSPVVLSGVAPHEVVRLAAWGDAGDVLEIVHHPETGALVPAATLGDKGVRPDARMMTGSEIFREYFGLEGSTPNPMGDELRRYAMLASDPYRTEAEHKELLELSKKLAKAKISNLPKVLRRRQE